VASAVRGPGARCGRLASLPAPDHVARRVVARAPFSDDRERTYAAPVRRADRKRSDELRRVYRDHVDAVYGFFAYSVAQATAEDLTSTTFERVVRSWHTYDPSRAGERTWILVIARNALADHFRRAHTRSESPVEEVPDAIASRGLGADALDRILDQDELRQWLQVLGERERAVLALRYAGDLTANQIAQVLDLTPANVHQILSRSLRRLRESEAVVSGSAASEL